MTFRARVALAKRVPPGEGVSYGHDLDTSRETTLALVPVGYADGVPRALNVTAGCRCSSAASCRPVVGRVCMDQVDGRLRRRRGRRRATRSSCSAATRRADRAGLGRRARHHPLRGGHRRARRARHAHLHRGRRVKQPGWGVLAGALGAAAAPASPSAWRPGSARRSPPTGEGSPPSSPRPASPAGRALLGGGRRRRAPVRARRSRPRRRQARPHRRARARVRARPAHLALPAPLPRRTSPTRACAWCSTTSAATAAPSAPPARAARSSSSATTSTPCIRALAPEGPLVLVGHSMGGMTIMALAEQLPGARSRSGWRAWRSWRRRRARSAAPGCRARCCRGATRSPAASACSRRCSPSLVEGVRKAASDVVWAVTRSARLRRPRHRARARGPRRLHDQRERGGRAHRLRRHDRQPRPARRPPGARHLRGAGGRGRRATA